MLKVRWVRQRRNYEASEEITYQLNGAALDTVWRTLIKNMQGICYTYAELLYPRRNRNICLFSNDQMVMINWRQTNKCIDTKPFIPVDT